MDTRPARERSRTLPRSVFRQGRDRCGLRARSAYRLTEVHRRLEVRRATDMPRKLRAPIAPLFHNIERNAEAMLSAWKAS